VRPPTTTRPPKIQPHGSALGQLPSGAGSDPSGQNGIAVVAVAGIIAVVGIVATLGQLPSGAGIDPSGQVNGAGGLGLGQLPSGAGIDPSGQSGGGGGVDATTAVWGGCGCDGSG